ncbi:hypothetical protein [Halocatena halophila]|uniref:hypothetical protein n=1 Tax=Halocatena halophila TaxID=2814576 RepID=UPI002ED3304B
MDREVSRREAMKFVGGIALTTGLAGCTSDEQTGGTAEPETPGNQTPTPPSDNATPTPPQETETATETETETATPSVDPGEEVSVATSSGSSVSATIHGDGSCGVVLVHGSEHSYTDWAPQANAIADGGHVVLSIDASAGSATANAERVAGGVSHLKEQQGASAVIAVGAGSGSEAVIRANNSTNAIDGTVAISPESASAAQIAPDISGQLLVVVGSGDEQNYQQVAQAMYTAASDPKQKEDLATDKHGQAIFSGEQGSNLESLLVEFTNSICSA